MLTDRAESPQHQGRQAAWVEKNGGQDAKTTSRTRSSLLQGSSTPSGASIFFHLDNKIDLEVHEMADTYSISYSVRSGCYQLLNFACRTFRHSVQCLNLVKTSMIGILKATLEHMAVLLKFAFERHLTANAPWPITGNNSCISKQ